MPHWSLGQWCAAVLAAFAMGLAKTGVPGIGIVAVPIFALLLPAKESVGTVLLILICADCLAVVTYRRDGDTRQLLRLLPWTALGVAVGWWALERLDDLQAKRLIGAILLFMVGLALVRRLQKPTQDAALPSWAAPLVGMVAGFTTMVANAAGPITTLYLLSMRLSKLQFLGTAAWFYFTVNVIKVPFGLHRHLITGESLLRSAPFFPAALLGGLIGRVVAQRLDQKRFELLAWLLTLPAALWLLLGDRIVAALR